MRMLAAVVSRLVIRLLGRVSRTRTPRPRRRDLALVAMLGAMLLPGFSATLSVRAGTPTVLMGAAGPLQPPATALQPNGAAGDGIRSLGLIQPSEASATSLLDSAPITAAAALPPSVDLSADSPPVGSQGSVDSCVSWVTGYYLRGWYAKHNGYYPSGGPDGAGGFAPMYLFSQITNGQNKGTTFNANLDMMVSQGVDSRADYTQGDGNYTDQPTTAERTGAAPYKIAGYTILFVGANQGSPAQQAIEASLAAGNPVSIGLPVYDPFWNADATHDYVDVTNLGTNHGNHAVFAAKYDANGLWVENQWGTDWGLNGWVELSWAFVNQYVWEAATMRVATLPATAPINVPPAVTATPLPPTATSTPVTATSVTTPVSPTASVPAGTPTPPSTPSTRAGSPTPTASTQTATPPATPQVTVTVKVVLPTRATTTTHRLPRPKVTWQRAMKRKEPHRKARTGGKPHHAAAPHRLGANDHGSHSRWQWWEAARPTGRAYRPALGDESERMAPHLALFHWRS